MTFIKNSSLGAKIAISAIGVVFALMLLFGATAPAQAALTTTQIDAIIGLLQSFGAEQSVIDNVRVSLTGDISSGGGGGSSYSCPTLKYNMYFGIEDNETNGEVTTLQKFLARDNSVYPEGDITGYFGPMTERAVQKWQTKHGVVSSGTADTTGYGAAGPKTREAIKMSCGGSVILSSPPVMLPPVIECPTVSLPADILCVAGTVVSTGIDANGCQLPPKCIVPGANLPPVISGVSGPTILNVGQTGTWTVNASDPENSDLSYSVDWGDEFAIASSVRPSAVAPYQTATFTHTYSQAGTYIPTFTVTDNTGQQARTSVSVNVGATASSITLSSQITSRDLSQGITSVTYTISDPLNASSYKLTISCPAGVTAFMKETPACGTISLWQGLQKFSITFTNTSGSSQNILSKLVAYAIDGSPIGGDSDVIGNIPTATNQSITILTPNGGEKWQIGNTHSITWTPYSYSPTAINPSADVTGYLQRVRNGSFEFIGKIMASEKASILWTTDIDRHGNSAVPGDYYIYVINNKTGEWDRSDRPFTLVARNTITADLKVNGSDGPVTGQTGGVYYDVSWTSNAEQCEITTNSEQISNLPPSGSKLMKIPINGFANLYCNSKTDIEGSAYDNVNIISSTAYQCSDGIDNDGDGLVDYPSDPGCVSTIDNDESNQVTPPSVTINSPNMGGSLNWSEQYKIVWKSTGGIDSFSLALYKDDKFFNWIVTNFPAQGGLPYSYTWTPSDVISQADIKGTGSVFKVDIIGHLVGGAGTVTSKSDSDIPFSIYIPTTESVTVTSPNGGETWTLGKTQTVSWSASGDVLAIPYLYKGNTLVRTLSPSYVASPINIWVDPSLTPGNDYKIKVKTNKGNLEDYSDSAFSIVAPATTNLPPTIGTVSGPTTLNVGQTGTWKVTASDPEGCLKSWGVEWGDGPGQGGGSIGCVSTKTYGGSYAYSKAGVYNQIYTVTDDKGQNAKTSLSVNVWNDSAQPSITVLTPYSGETLQIGSTYTITWSQSGFTSDKINIYLYDPATNKYSFIERDAVNSGSHTWKVNTVQWIGEQQSIEVPPGDYKIYLLANRFQSSTGTNISDFSDAPFSIVAASVSQTQISQLASVFNVTEATIREIFKAIGL
jgi:peptidoglycan hydrolase-like protein with peptidoglycan-binding domain